MAPASDPYFIQSYGDGGFRVNEEDYIGSIIVARDAVYPWPIKAFADISPDSFDKLTDTGILLIGTGNTFIFLDPKLRATLSARGLSADAMNTGAACRTFNVLLAEDRPVIAALIAVD